MQTKRCADCNADRPISEFGKCRTNKSGLQYYCREHCRIRAKAQARKNYAKNPGKYLARMKKWRKDNLARHNEIAQKSRVKYLYGLTLEEYDALKQAAGGRCQICKRKTKLHIDHDHKTTKVRGLLCMHCNHALGKFSDSVKVLQAAIAYLQR